MAVSDAVNSAIETARQYPRQTAVLAVGGVGLVVFVKMRGKTTEVQGGDPIPSPDAYGEGGTGMTPFPNPPGGTGMTPFPNPPGGNSPIPNIPPIPGKPGPIKGQAMRITEADRAVYECPDSQYLRYGRGDNVNKIVCVVRDGPSKGRERNVIVKPR